MSKVSRALLRDEEMIAVTLVSVSRNEPRIGQDKALVKAATMKLVLWLQSQMEDLQDNESYKQKLDKALQALRQELGLANS